MGLCTICAVIFFFVAIFICYPVRAFWTMGIPIRCLNLYAHELSMAAVGLFLDLYVLIFPIPMVLRLRVPTRQKLGLVFVFTIGIVYGPVVLLNQWWRS